MPFYTSEIQKLIKKPQIKKEFIKKPKVSNKELSQALPFHPKKSKKLTKMGQNYKNTDLLKFLLFYTSEIQKSIKKEVIKKRKISNKELSQALLFHPKKTKKVTKRQILENIFPLFEDIGIIKRERAFRGSAETYNIEVIDDKSLRDSLYIAKRSITDFLKDKLQEKRGFRYGILTVVTMKKWKSEFNAREFQNIYIRSDAITATRQRFYLNDD